VDLDALGVHADGGDRPRLARDAAGQLERVGVADGVDGRVHAAALGCFLHFLPWVVLGEMD
jgi:hypothetical protein